MEKVSFHFKIGETGLETVQKGSKMISTSSEVLEVTLNLNLTLNLTLFDLEICTGQTLAIYVKSHVK